MHAHAQRINEICSKNDGIIVDKDGDFPDWIEIYNPTNKTVNLNQFYLSDDESELDQWKFPTYMLTPHNYVLVFASDKETVNQELHCNFKISSKGEQLYLSNLKKEIVQRVDCPELKTNHSFGLDSLVFKFYEMPSPLEANNKQNGYKGYAPQLNFSIKENSIVEGSSLQLTCEPSFQIYYTIDGSLPLPYGSLYKEALVIDSTISIKAVCHHPDYITANPLTKTYFVNESTHLPLININVEPTLFFNDTTGIYATGLSADTIWPFWGANYWWDKEVPVSFEFYDSKNEDYFTENCVVEIHGGKGSRTNPMRSLRLEADDAVGAEKFEFPFFNTDALNEYYRLVLRNASGDYNKGHCRDALVAYHILKEDLQVDVLANKAVNVFINGEYWGLYHLRERFDQYYFKTKYNFKTDFNFLEKDTGVIEGNRLSFDTLYQKILQTDCSNNTECNEVLQHFDINNLNDYFIAELFFNNTDWPRNNVKYWQHPHDLKWRYVLFDVDAGMGLLDWNGSDFNLMGNILKETYDETHANILRCFLENTSFKQQFINRFADLLNTAFQVQKLQNSLTEMIETIQPELPQQFEKWNGDLEVWQDHIENISNYFNKKPQKQFEYINQQFSLNGTYELTVDVEIDSEAQISINTLKHIELPFNGQYFSNNPIEINVKASNPALVFKYWHDTLNDAYYFSEQLILESNQPVNLKAFYLNETEASPENYVFPTLVHNQLLVGYSKEIRQLRLLNSAGQVVFSERFNTNSECDNRLVVDLAQLAKGVYFLFLQNPKKEVAFKLIKL